jgi:FkbM family methyltransferase
MIRVRTCPVEIIAYRLLGYKKIKLPFNNSAYWDALEKVKSLKKGNDTIDPHFMHFALEHFDLRPIGYNLELYFFGGGIVIDFIIEQYAYKLNDKYILHAEKDDVVLDIGACWGDTTLYFADKVGDNGKVFSFEFIPDNIKIYNINMGLNSHFNKRIQLVENPVSDISGQEVYYENNGPGSKIFDFPFKTHTGSATTISVDDFVDRYNISKIDFIKMDKEGAELAALRGALKTITKHKPRLAIAIYHSMEDFVNIPKWLMDLNLGYEFYLGHYTIYAEETVIYANPKDN